MVKSPSKTLGGKRKFGHLALQGAEEGTSAAAAALNSLPQFSQTNPIDVSWHLIFYIVFVLKS